MREVRKMETKNLETMNNPGMQEYAPCGCSQNVFRFKAGGICGRIFEVRYWLATDPKHNHRHDKLRSYVVREESGGYFFPNPLDERDESIGDNLPPFVP